MSGVLAWIVLGLIAGVLAQLIYPGRQAGGILATIGLGVLGAILGGYLGKALVGTSAIAAIGAFTILSIALAVIGAIVLIFSWGILIRKAA